MLKTVLFFLKEEKQIELQDKQGQIFTLQDHTQFFKFWLKVIQQMKVECFLEENSISVI
jgi:hypothetical protein